MPTLSVIVPTPGRPSLSRLLDSIAGQGLVPGDEVLVCGDTHDGPLPGTEALVRTYGDGFRYLECDAGRHAWGNPQRNHAIRQARAGHLVFNDDDDVFTPGAFDTIRAVLASQPAQRPMLFRFQAHYGQILWLQVGLAAEGYIGGHCCVAPNRDGLVGTWSDRYQGDHDFITSTLAHYDNVADWCPPVIAVARPALAWKRVSTPAEVESLRLLRNAGREWMTRDTREISPPEQDAWWSLQSWSTVRAYLFTEDTRTVGAGVLTLRDDGRWWITVLVDPACRGRGIGTTIFLWLRYAPPGDVWAEIRADNAASIRAASKAFYQAVETTSERVLLVAR